MTNNVNNKGPDSERDAKKEVKPIREIASLFYASPAVAVEFDFHEVLELRILLSGKWVRVTLEEIEDTEAKRLSEIKAELEEEPRNELEAEAV